MADGQKCNIPLGEYGKGMSLGLQLRDIPMSYPPHGILRFYPSAMWSCYKLMNKAVNIQRIDTVVIFKDFIKQYSMDPVIKLLLS